MLESALYVAEMLHIVSACTVSVQVEMKIGMCMLEIHIAGARHD